MVGLAQHPHLLAQLLVGAAEHLPGERAPHRSRLPKHPALLGQIGEALGSHTLRHIASVASWALPFEALYQDGLRQLTAHVTGTTGAIVKLGPFGGAQDFGALLWPYAIAYLAAVTGLGIALFRRRDL